MSKEKLPLISAGTYYGLPSENPNDFIDKHENAEGCNHWKEETRIHLFPAHLAGTELTWYQHYSSGRDINSWKHLKDTFILTFTPVAQAQRLQAILERKIQGKDKPVFCYYLKIITLCRRHDPTTTEKQIIQHVIQGLRPEYSKRILGQTCDNLQQLEDNLRRFKVQVEMGRMNRERFRRAEKEKTGHTYYDRHRVDINSLQAEIKSLTQTVANLKIHYSQPRREYSGFR